VTTTACKTSSGSSSSGRGADDDEEEKITGISENEEGEEEEGNPLPGTPQQPEQALDQDIETLQQLKQQSEQEEVEDAAIMAKNCDMTPRLQFWYGNSKDRTSIEWWCDSVDRIRDQKGWNNEQGKKSAASVAVNPLREEAALLMTIIAKGHQSAAVKDWLLMKPILIKRYSTINTCKQRAKQFATLTQKSGEPVENFYNRTQMAMIIVHEKPRAAIPVAEVERLRGYNECADGTQALLFVAGLLPYLKTFVDDRIEEDSTLEQILKWAVKGEQSRRAQGPQHQRRAGGGARASPGKGVGGRDEGDGDQVQEPAQRRDSRRKRQLQGHRCKAKGKTADERRQRRRQQQRQRRRNERRPSTTTTNGAERQMDLLQLLLTVG
jgi:hypothetical protein